MRRAAALLVACLWALEFALLLTSLRLEARLSPGDVFRHAATAACGVLVSAALGYALLRARRRPFWQLLLVALGFGLAFSLANLLISLATGGLIVANGPGFTSTDETASGSIAQGLIFWFRIFLAGSGCLLAAAYALDAREGERRTAEAQAVAHRAQLAALRYQVNPHFLFNTLNAVSALVGARDLDRAEAMIANLSDFMRTSLTTDPFEDITLQAELAYERLYLDIEQVRFPDRLKVIVDLPEDLRAALVPSLILQPVIENAIKHGVARSAEPVTIAIVASSDGAALELAITDDARATGPAPRPGAGVGLANVRARLAARFGALASVENEARPQGGHVVRLRLPLRYAEYRRGESE